MVSLVEENQGDAYTQGLNYLQQMRSAAHPHVLIDVLDNVRDRSLICTWIGTHIHTVNSILQDELIACHNCYPLSVRRSLQIFAVPLSPSLGLDGFCHLSDLPVLFIDPGRVAPSGWRALVAHEYAHAHLGKPGHDHHFAMILTHLCLGLGLEPPLEHTEAILQRSPHYYSTLDPLAFWRGESWTPPSLVKN